MEQNEIDEIKKEFKKEFKVERLILFSDAVFAIVITLVAIEIKLPHFEEKVTPELLENALIHLLPILISYIMTFYFIGMQWYSHLKLFSVLKNYDGGLIFRNLLLLFFLGLMPSCVSLFTEVSFSDINSSLISGDMSSKLIFGIYFFNSCCVGLSMRLLGKYIISKPELLEEDADISELTLKYNKWFYKVDKKTNKKSPKSIWRRY